MGAERQACQCCDDRRGCESECGCGCVRRLAWVPVVSGTPSWEVSLVVVLYTNSKARKLRLVSPLGNGQAYK